MRYRDRPLGVQVSNNVAGREASTLGITWTGREAPNMDTQGCVHIRYNMGRH